MNSRNANGERTSFAMNRPLHGYKSIERLTAPPSLPSVSWRLAIYPTDRHDIAEWENEGGSVTLIHAIASHDAPQLGVSVSRPTPLVAFLNDLGVRRIMVGVHQFECVGASPPHDHPHVFLEMGEHGEVLCPYCATLFTFDGTLARRETRPPNCCY